MVICTDADVDGFQIRTLILTMLYRLCPTLIQEGYVYIAETPCMRSPARSKDLVCLLREGKGDSLRELEGKKVHVQRSKGLGENDPEMMWLTTMNPETRRLIRVMPEDAEETAQVFDLLLGDNLQGRKDYIAENGYKYLDHDRRQGSDEIGTALRARQHHVVCGGSHGRRTVPCSLRA